uniref:Multiple epidermal growth factor-like domains protein 6 isoform X2 n=1 Tax=Crassostrea virginica TaxID=6565 RepID=A0A8B8E868_CRAVI|nr:multiple epidermal growth factor-like domains protein 6 isoform X2 [Crassostrea virginica]
MVDGLCIACPKGTFGEDCSEECPTDKYGELCSNECHCRPTEPCDPIHGCINTEGTCNVNGSEVQCCTNYILINGRCEALMHGFVIRSQKDYSSRSNG